MTIEEQEKIVERCETEYRIFTREHRFNIWNCIENKFCGKDYTHGDIDVSYRGDIYLDWTGLKDSSGIEIYEGDIIKFEDRHYVIHFHMGSFKADTLPCKMKENEKYLTETVNLGMIYDKGVLVVGNVFENKELLK